MFICLHETKLIYDGVGHLNSLVMFCIYLWIKNLKLFTDDDHAHIAELMDRDLAIPAENDVKPLPINNLKQQEAIDKALGSRFTLIQGPPGICQHWKKRKEKYINKLPNT